MVYRSVSDFYKDKFGCKVYKISLDAGCTCPTRDGTKGTRLAAKNTAACSFCAIACWASAARIKRNLVDFAAEFFFVEVRNGTVNHIPGFSA